jgi:lambda family phage tail tape measure protein
MAQPTQVRRIEIKVDGTSARDIKSIADALGGVTKNTKEMAKQMGAVSAAGVTWLGGFGISQLTSFSDEIQNMNNRLVAMSGSQEGATKTMSGLLDISRETSQSLASTSESYFRLSLALKDAGISQATLLDTTKTIANTFRLSGASAQEAANATIQLGQSFSLGVLRGQDLRSVMSQNVTLTRLLRQEFGNNLLKAAEKGLITVPKIMQLLHDNMEKVNAQAALMRPTFEQSLTKAMDAFKIQVFQAGEALGASGLFATGIQFAIEHIKQLSIVVTVFSIATLPALIKSLYTLAGTLGLLNPIVLTITAVVAGLLALNPSISKNLDPLDQLARGFFKMGFWAEVALEKVVRLLAKMPGPLGLLARNSIPLIQDLQKGNEAVISTYDDLAKRIENANKKVEESPAAKAAKFAADMKKLMDTFKEDPDAGQMLAKLNKRFLDLTISVSEYNREILSTEVDIAQKKFKERTIDLGKRNDMLRKIKVFDLNQQFKDGAITVEKYTEAIRNVGLENLQEDLQAGRISLQEFHIKLASVSNSFSAGGAFRSGLSDYIKSIGTTTQNVADVIKGAFSGLEEQLTNFITKGKTDFKAFTQAILDDLTKIVVRAMIIQPLASGILNLLPGASPTTAQASTGSVGTYRPGPVDTPFAKGGVVNSATGFNFGGGRSGIMGEAGPEAILPLSRDGGGVLGVKASVNPVTINIINQSGNEVQQSESTGPNGEKQIDILITGRVKAGISSGKYDSVFKNSFGMNRKGS